MHLATEAVQALVGTTVTYRAPEPLGPASIRYYAAAIGSDPDRWRNEAPPTLVCDTCQLTGLVAADGDGYLGHSWNLPLPEPCQMIRGGNAYRFHRPARPDDLIITRWALDQIDERSDGAGVPMLVVTATATYVGEGGHDDRIATNTETLLYRPAGAAPAPRPPAELKLGPGEPVPDLVRRIEPVDLMAYGAATWDWHRLHHDDAYARGRGLDGPIVDGQMFGALLAELALRTAGPGGRLLALEFRNRAPVAAGTTITCHGVRNDDRLDLAVTAGGRAVVASGTARIAV